MKDITFNFLIRLIQKRYITHMLTCLVFWSSKDRKKLRKSIFNLVHYDYIKKVQDKLVKKFQKKDTINVVFLGIDSCMWPYDGLYHLMEKHPRINPVIIVIPHNSFGKSYSKEIYDKTLKFFRGKTERVLSSWDEDKNTFRRLEDIMPPDIIFYTSPYDISLPQYNIGSWYDRALTCYVPYGIMQANIQETQYNLFFHNVIWRCFYETQIHREMAEKYARNIGRNVIVTGYPKIDIFLDNHYIPLDVWKTKNTKAKRIIWAPHHTIENGLNFSNFLEYAEFFINILKAYPNDIHIAFKPHPTLRANLYKCKEWGVYKTDAYYKLWDTLPNAQLEEGDYADLFLTSDALIHDSVSFIAEYACLDKPMLFMIKEESSSQKFNEFGSELFETVHVSENEDEVRQFIKLVLDDQPDPRQAVRQAFANQYLREPVVSSNMTASESIMSYLNETMKIEE